MVSYRPLWHTLVDRGLKKMQLVEMAGISTAENRGFRRRQSQG